MDKQLTNWLNNVLEKVDDIQLHLSLDREDLADAYEKQKEDLRKFAGETEEKMKELTEDERVKSFRAKLDELRVQLALGKAESREAFEEQREKVDKYVHELKQDYEDIKKDPEHKLHKVVSEFDEFSDGFKTRLDLFRLHFALGRADLRDELAEKKEAIERRVQTVKSKLNAKKEEVKEEVKDEKKEEKWEHFTQEVSAGLAHIENAIKGLFSS